MLYSPSLPSLSFAREVALVPAVILLLTLQTRALLPSAPAFFKHLVDIPTSCQFFYLITENQCVPLRPFNTQITGLTHHCSCWSWHLFPRLNLANLPHPSLFLLVTPLPCPYSFCPKLSGHGGNLIFHLQAKNFHEQRQGGRVLFPCRNCHLSPQFKPLRGRHPNRPAFFVVVTFVQ